ncbi:D-2-hydroxyacid dehydrogenase [Marinomonas agarivorans]|nr:D-2-hydroxyacid dehydrogenase [Marinomonas agarivorans]
MKAVFLDRGSFAANTRFDFSDLVSHYDEYQITDASDTLSRIQNADIVITNKVILNADILSQAPKVKYILILATGTNNVDLSYCQANQIQVDNIEGYSTDTVPEHTFAMLLALKRNLLSYQQAMKDGKWANSDHFCLRDFPLTDLANTNMIIIGSGALGQRVKNIAEAFNMNTYFAERKGQTQCREGYLPFERALKIADVITLHCPLTDNTKNMIAEAEFALMKPSTLLINTGRGGLVSETALSTAIKTQQIAGAAFDVATQEPMPADHPLQALTDYPNFLLTPHVAWASDGAMQKLANIAQQKLTNFVEVITSNDS